MIAPVLICMLFAQDQGVAELIRSLNDDDIDIRRKAADELLQRGSGVEEALWVVLIRGESLEAVLTAKDLLRRMGKLGQTPFGTLERAGMRFYTATDTRRFGKLEDDPSQPDLGR